MNTKIDTAVARTAIKPNLVCDARAFLRSIDGTSGGDFVACVESLHGLTFFVGDACGHGRAAVPLKCRLAEAVADLVSIGVSPRTALTILNHFVCSTPEFSARDTGCATIFFGRIDLDSGTLTYASAAHETAFLIAPGAAPIELSATGPLVGIDPEQRFEERTVPIGHRSSMLVATDGLVNARSLIADDRYGTRRLANVLAATLALDAGARLARVLSDLERFTRDRLSDDLAIFSASFSVTRSAFSAT